MAGIDTTHAHIKAQTLDVAVGGALCVMRGVGASTVKLPTGTGVELVGVTIDNGGAIDAIVPIVCDGADIRVTASAAVAIDALVCATGTAGKVATAAPAAGVNTFILGKALEAATADGDQILIRLRPQWMQGA